MLGELRAARDSRQSRRRTTRRRRRGQALRTARHRGRSPFLRDTGHLSGADGETPLATTAAFALSQLQALRALSTSLRNIGPDLTSVDEDDGPRKTSGASGWRRDRLEYVEGAARKHLEVVARLELGGNGEVLGNDEGRGEQDRRFAPARSRASSRSLLSSAAASLKALLRRPTTTWTNHDMRHVLGVKGGSMCVCVCVYGVRYLCMWTEYE